MEFTLLSKRAEICRFSVSPAPFFSKILYISIVLPFRFLPCHFGFFSVKNSEPFFSSTSTLSAVAAGSFS